MNNLPRLVKEIIGWYQWKDRMRSINLEFLSLFIAFDFQNNHINRRFYNTYINCRVFSIRSGYYILAHNYLQTPGVICRFDK